MQSKAATVKEYLASLPDDRRQAVETVRNVILKNLDKDYEEGMQYGMIGYYVPHRIFPAGYHCDPRIALPFAGLASQKNHLSIYLMGLYCGCIPGQDNALATWFQEAWAKTGKKLDMGKACIRFTKVENLALDVLGEAIRRLPAKKYIEHYEAALASMGKSPAKPASPKKAAAGKSPAKKSAAPAKTAKKPVKKKVVARAKK